MALSTPFVGSGEFVAEREWSCPDHDEPQTHECDCGHCDIPYYTCEGCANAAWVEKRDADGNVVTYELSVSEAGWRRLWASEAKREADKADLLLSMLADGRDAKVSWVEDATIPIVRSRG